MTRWTTCEALDYLTGDDTARGRSEPDKEEDFKAWLIYRDGWMAAYMDKFNRKRQGGGCGGRDAGQSGGERVNPTLREIVETYLRQNGFDGLYNLWIECGCTVDDLMPCERADEVNCAAGYRVRLEDGGWGIGPNPERVSDE